MNSNQLPALSPEIIEDLRNRYGEPEIPKCSICGGELSVQRAGGGSATIWACSGMIDDPTGERNWIYAEGRSMADDHYERSRWTDYRRGCDSEVIDLINAYQTLAAQTVSQRYKLPDAVEAEADKNVRIHGSSFVLFRNGQEPVCLDLSKIVITVLD